MEQIASHDDSFLRLREIIKLLPISRLSCLGAPGTETQSRPAHAATYFYRTNTMPSFECTLARPELPFATPFDIHPKLHARVQAKRPGPQRRPARSEADRQAAALEHCRPLPPSEGMRTMLVEMGVKDAEQVCEADVLYRMLGDKVFVECPVCLTAHEEGDCVVRLPCGHSFHRGCAQRRAGQL